MLNRKSYNGVKDSLKFSATDLWNDYFNGFTSNNISKICYSKIISKIILENQYSFKGILSFLMDEKSK